MGPNKTKYNPDWLTKLDKNESKSQIQLAKNRRSLFSSEATFESFIGDRVLGDLAEDSGPKYSDEPRMNGSKMSSQE